VNLKPVPVYQLTQYGSRHRGLVFGEKGVKFHLSNPPKGTTLARTTYNDVLRVGVCPEM